MIENNNYECKRCSYQCYQLNDMKKHLNKKIICLRNIESYNYKDEDLIKLSLIRKNNDKKFKENYFICNICYKSFCNKSNLNRHKNLFCKKIEKNENENINKKSINITKNIIEELSIIENKSVENNSTENKSTENKSVENKSTENKSVENKSVENKSIENKSVENKSIENNSIENKSVENKSTENNSTENNSTENNSTENNSTEKLLSDNNFIHDKNKYKTDNKNIYNITNNYTNNINLNINLINSFEENWSTTHIDDKTKCLLLLNNSKFTATLENILENNINLNVLLDNTSENGLVYNKDTFINMNVKDIVKTTMDKLYNKLCDFKNDILISEKNLNIDQKLLEDHIQIAQSKYNNYIQDICVQESVDIFIKDIYNKKKVDTLVNYNSVKNGY